MEEDKFDIFEYDGSGEDNEDSESVDQELENQISVLDEFDTKLIGTWLRGDRNIIKACLDYNRPLRGRTLKLKKPSARRRFPKSSPASSSDDQDLKVQDNAQDNNVRDDNNGQEHDQNQKSVKDAGKTELTKTKKPEKKMLKRKDKENIKKKKAKPKKKKKLDQSIIKRLGIYPPDPPSDSNVNPNSDWSLDDVTQPLPRYALSSESATEKDIREMSCTDYDDPVWKERRTFPTYEKVGDVFVYHEPIARKLLHKHFNDEDDNISVSSIENVEYYAEHGIHMDHRFRFSLGIPFHPVMQSFINALKTYLHLLWIQQAHYIILAIVWSAMWLALFFMETRTFCSQWFWEKWFVILLFEAAFNWILPVFAIIRTANQRLRTIVILYDIFFFIFSCHLVFLVPISAFNIYEYVTGIEKHMEQEMDVFEPNYLWHNTQILRECCGFDDYRDWWSFQDDRHDMGLQFLYPTSCFPARFVQKGNLSDNNLFKKGCGAEETACMAKLTVMVFLLSSLSLMLDVGAYHVLIKFREFLKRLKPRLLYGVPQWIYTRHETPQYNYGIHLPPRETELNLLHDGGPFEKRLLET